MNYADIIIDIANEKLDKTFQYAIPKELSAQVTYGTSVTIPFGNTIREGYVVGFSKTPKVPIEKIKPILEVSKGKISPSQHLMELAGWMKQRYGGTMYQAIRTVLPIKNQEKEKQIRQLKLDITKEEARQQLALLKKRKNHSEKKVALWEALLEQESLIYEQAKKELGIDSAIIREFSSKGFITIETQRSYRNMSLEQKSSSPITLNSAQKQVVAKIKELEEKSSNVYLLHGVTGSGKTQVYMEIIQQVLEKNQQVILLIPEIALTYQNVTRFYQRFGEQVSVIHSRMSYGERFDQFERAKNGEVTVMIGPRSALFTPFPNLGFIIIDEEHESSYKSESIPRYHGREVAIQRGKLCGCSVLLGSATPSVESYYRSQTGEYVLLELPYRAKHQPLPTTEIVDLRQELRQGNRSIISRSLQEKIEKRLEAKQQVMLFVNRRGLMGTLSCRACGHVIKCPHCDVALSLHQKKKLRCHYCGYETYEVTKCPSCNSVHIGKFRAGTQRYEEMIQQLFPQAKILRMDLDTTKGKEGHQKILKAFEEREADILIGTQMMIKGHDFSNVTLVGILAADLSLNGTDYSCGERTFQLLTQAAGRAGRGTLPGEVVIQTYQPEHEIILAAAKQDYKEFYQGEIQYRKLLHYPPSGTILLIQITSKMEPEAEAMAQFFVREIKKNNPKLVVLGPTDATVAKISDVYRKAIYLKHKDVDCLIHIKDVIEEYLLTQKHFLHTSVSFDINPITSF